MGLFDVWSSWSDWLRDWWNAFNDKIWDIKVRLWDWVDEIAKYWVSRANEWFDILNHTWMEVTNLFNEAKEYAGSLFEDLKDYAEDLMEQAKSYADDIVTDAIVKIDNWIATFGETVAELWNRLEPYFSAMITPLETAIDNIQNVKIPSLEDITNALKEGVDNILNTDIPFLNQSISDLWNETNEIWNEIWNNIWISLNNAWTDISNLWNTINEIPANVWNAITAGWDGFTDFLFEQGQKFVEKLLDVEVGLDDVVEELKRRYGGGGA